MNKDELNSVMDVLEKISETIEEIHSCIENDIVHTLGEVKFFFGLYKASK